jgi:hypothetical protein
MPAKKTISKETAQKTVKPRGKDGSEKRKKRRVESFAIYIYKVN